MGMIGVYLPIGAALLHTPVAWNWKGPPPEDGWKDLLPFLVEREVPPAHEWKFRSGRVLLGHPTAAGHCLVVCPGNSGVVLDKERPVLEEFQISPIRPVSAAAALLQSTGTLVLYGPLRAFWLLQAQVEADHLLCWADIEQPKEIGRSARGLTSRLGGSLPPPLRHPEPMKEWPAPPGQTEVAPSEAIEKDAEGCHKEEYVTKAPAAIAGRTQKMPLSPHKQFTLAAFWGHNKIASPPVAPTSVVPPELPPTRTKNLI